MKFKSLIWTHIACTKKNQDGKIWVHQDELYNEMVKEGKKPVIGLPKKKLPKDSSAKSTASVAKQVDHVPLEKSIQLSEEKKILIKEKELAEFRWSQGMYDSLHERAKILEKECDLEVHELHCQRKKEILHNRWTKDVYEPLKKDLATAIDNLSWTSVEAKKHHMYKCYLQYVNTKGHVFLETFDPKEYPRYPYSSGVPSKLETKVGPDPLMFEERQRLEEDRFMFHCKTGMKYNDSDLKQIKQNSLPKTPLGRNGMDCMKWLQMPLVNIESTPREASRQRVYAGKHNMSVMSDILQHPDPNTEILPDRRSISQPINAGRHVQPTRRQKTKESFPSQKTIAFSPTSYTCPPELCPHTFSFNSRFVCSKC